MRLVQAADIGAMTERGVAEVTGLPRRTVMPTVYGLEDLGLVRVVPGQPGVYGDARPALFSWDQEAMRTWLMPQGNPDQGAAGCCSFAHYVSSTSFSSTTTYRSGRDSYSTSTTGAWATEQHPLCQPRWAPQQLGTLGWQIAEVAARWSRSFGVREMAREISRCWEYGADAAMVLRRLRKMAEAPDELGVSATKDTQGRWTVEVARLAPRDEFDAAWKALDQAQGDPELRRILLGTLPDEPDLLAERIQRRHAQEITEHRSRRAPRTKGYLRGIAGAAWPRKPTSPQRILDSKSHPCQTRRDAIISGDPVVDNKISWDRDGGIPSGISGGIRRGLGGSGSASDRSSPAFDRYVRRGRDAEVDLDTRHPGSAESNHVLGRVLAHGGRA